MAINWLKLNDDKTEFIVLGSKANLSKVKTHSITVGEHQIQGSNQVRNIGQFLTQMPKWRAKLLLVKHVRQLSFIFIPSVKSVSI